MFKKRSLLSFRRPKSAVVQGSPRPGKTLVLSSPPLMSGFTTPGEHTRGAKNHNCVSAEPLFHEEFITPTSEHHAFDDQFVDYVSARTPEVAQIIDGLKADSDILPAEESSSILEEEDELDEYDSLNVEYLTIEDVAVSYPSGSVRVIDHDPWSFPPDASSRLPKIELEIPPRSPHRRLDSSGSVSVSSSASSIMPSTPESINWPLPDPTTGKVSRPVETGIVTI